MPFGPEVLIILGVVVLLFGGAKLPGLARSLGSAKQEFESASKTKVEAPAPVAEPVVVPVVVPTESAGAEAA